MSRFISWLMSFIGKSSAPLVESAVPAPAPVAIPSRIFKISISPGHGGEDPGAVNPTSKHTEADTARKICRALYKRFSSNAMFDVALQGLVEEKKNYTARVAASDARKDDYYIPVHLNSSTNRKANGFLAFVDPTDFSKRPELQTLCRAVLDNLKGQYDIGWSDWDGQRDGFMCGIDRPIYEASKPLADTVYLELGYISNDDWDNMLQLQSTIDNIANAVISGFESFLRTK